MERIGNTTENLQIIAAKNETGNGSHAEELVEETRGKFIEAMDDNFNSADALAVIFDFVREVNDSIRKDELNSTSAGKYTSLFEEWEDIFGVSFVVKREEKLTVEQQKLIQEREEARSKKDWTRADEIRDELKAQGIILEDGGSGTVWKKVKSD